MKFGIAAAVTAGVVLAMTVGTVTAGKDEIKPFVHVPKTWDEGVAEAKTLVLPIVVHSHGWN